MNLLLPMYTKLPRMFYTRSDVVQISKELLGKYLMTHLDGVLTGGKIVETEAYCGRTDRACHAYLNRRTKRTEIIYQEGGIAYVYICYGIHHLFNVVTNEQELADAVLIRAIEPTDGIDWMLKRRNMKKMATRLTGGPGCLTKALGITRVHYGTDLQGKTIWIEDRQNDIVDADIIACPRIGIDYAGTDALLPWRFYIKGNKWVSRISS